MWDRDRLRRYLRLRLGINTTSYIRRPQPQGGVQTDVQIKLPQETGSHGGRVCRHYVCALPIYIFSHPQSRHLRS